MRNKPVFLFFAISLAFYIAGTIFLKDFSGPDPGFIIFILFSIYIGPLYGAVLGFLCGLSVDILSISPLGFHSAVFVIIGYIYGKFKGKLFVDPIIVPVLLVLAAVFLKALFGYIILLLISDSESINFFFDDFWKKFFFSGLASPFVYFALKSLNLINLNEKD